MLYLPLVVSLFTLIFVFFLIKQIHKVPSGDGLIIKASLAIKEGVMVFLKRQYKTLAVVVIFIFFILWIILGFKTGLGFLVGAIASGAVGFMGMMISTQANLKVAEASKTGLEEAFSLSFKGSSVTGFLAVGLAILIVSGFYLLTNDLKALIAVGFGGSLISVFARLAGGIYTEATDVGTDLAGKIKKGTPEGDPKNPAVIADQVGDNVGDCAGIAADLFETYVVTIIAAMVLGGLLFPNISMAVFLPLFLASLAILASIISTYFVQLEKNQNIIFSLFKGLIIAGVLSAAGFYAIISQVTASLKISSTNLYLSAVIGLLIAGGIFLITDFFTSKKHSQVKSIALASKSRHGQNILQGLVVGMKSTIPPAILISMGILISFSLAGAYGLAICIVSMLSLTGLIIALGFYGPITDNASGIAKMSGFPTEAILRTSALDAVGNTTKATTKGYAITSAGLAALVLFSTFTQELANFGVKAEFRLGDPKVLVGLFFGGILTYYFSALAINAVGGAASKVVEEIRRQFREIKGLMTGEAKPDYSKCVDIVTKVSLKEMILPALLPIIFPILIGFILGAEALGGLLIGSIIVGIFLAIKMTSGGAAWDNAKKWIEEGNLGGKGSFFHQAAVTGDTVGLSINSMIKILNIVALLIVSFLI